MKIMDLFPDAVQLQENDTFCFECRQCADCCRNVANAVMLESLDVFRIARHFQMEPAEVVEMYSEARTVAWGAPILMLKTTGSNHSCVFLESGKCSIEPVKPRTCKLYPLSVGPDDDLVNRIIIKTPERQFHYHGKSHRTGDWADTNMSTEAAKYIELEYRAFQSLGWDIRRIPRELENDVLMQMLLFRYCYFDTSKNFLTQYRRNIEQLKSQLKNMAL
jgi:Fe-S-cluster containining protein